MKNYAFFDVDDTLVSIKTMFSFQEYWYKKHQEKDKQKSFEKEMQHLNTENMSWELINKQYYKHFSGRKIADVEKCAAQWFSHIKQKKQKLFHTNIVKELYKHQAQNIEIVFISGSFPTLLQPIAKHLNVNHILAINMDTNDGYYTGEILPPQTIGRGKAEAISSFLNKNGASARHCYGYADDISDLQMLSMLGFPTVVSGGRGLEAYAKNAGWRILSPF